MIARAAATLAVAALALSGCYDDVGVTLHEPGVYKGTPDPLLELQRSASQQERLNERFAQVQTDR